MDDLSKLSDSELQALQAQRQQPAPDASKMSDTELATASRAKNPTWWDHVTGAYKALDTGVAGAVAGLAALPHTLSEMGQALKEKQLSTLEGETDRTLKRPDQQPFAMQWPSEADFRKTIQQDFYGGEAPYKPQNLAEEGLKTAGEFSLAGIGPGGPLARLARIAAPTVASETLGQLTKDTPQEPLARAAGALIGGGVQGGAEALISRPRTATAILERQLPAGITPAHVDAAQTLMQDAATQGMRLTWPEALSQVAQRPVLSDTMRHLEASSASGPRMAEFFGDRPQRVEGAVAGQAQAISPGAPTDPYQLGPAIGQQATDILTQERQAINARSDPHYAAAALQFADPREMMRLEALPGWNDAAQAVRTNPQLSRDVQGLPESSLGFINEVKKQMQARGEHATSPMRPTGAPSAQEASGWFSDADVVRQQAINASRRQTAPGVPAPYEEALRIESEMRAQRLQPLLEGPLGKLAKSDLEIENAVGTLFPRDPKKIHGEAAIGDAVSRIAARSPKLAEDAVRAHVEMAFDKAGRDLASGPNQASGANFRALTAGSGQQRRNLQAAVEALPNGPQRWEGFNRLLDVMEATGTRQNVGSRTAYNVEALKEFGAGGGVKDLAQTIANPVSGLQKYSDRYNQWKLGQNLNDLAGILTEPRSANLLRQIAASPRGGSREANVIRALFASQAAMPAIKAAGAEANQ
jgi:hypothetical protein